MNKAVCEKCDLKSQRDETGVYNFCPVVRRLAGIGKLQADAESFARVRQVESWRLLFILVTPIVDRTSL